MADIASKPKSKYLTPEAIGALALLGFLSDIFVGCAILAFPVYGMYIASYFIVKYAYLMLRYGNILGGFKYVGTMIANLFKKKD